MRVHKIPNYPGERTQGNIDPLYFPIQACELPDEKSNWKVQNKQEVYTTYS